MLQKTVGKENEIEDIGGKNTYNDYHLKQHSNIFIVWLEKIDMKKKLLEY